MSGLADQLPALIGVVVGGVMSYAAGALTERSRWRRQQATRWDERLLQAYSDYGHAVKECSSYYLRLAAGRNLTDHPAPLESTNDVLEQAATAERRRSAMVEPLSLLTDARTAEAIRALNRSLWHLEWLARGRKPGDTATWANAFSDYRAARADFYQHARRSLQVAEMTDLQEAPWPPSWRPAREPSDP